MGPSIFAIDLATTRSVNQLHSLMKNLQGCNITNILCTTKINYFINQTFDQVNYYFILDILVSPLPSTANFYSSLFNQISIVFLLE